MTDTFRVEVVKGGFIIYFRDNDEYFWKYVSSTGEFFYRKHKTDDWLPTCNQEGCDCGNAYPVMDVIRGIIREYPNISICGDVYNDRMIALQEQEEAERERIRNEEIKVRNAFLASILAQ
jgi:hypothetical protein